MRPLTLLLLGAALLAAPALASDLDVAYVTDSTNDAVWRLEDRNADGDHDDLGETVEFYSDVLGTQPLSNNIGVTRGADGTVYVCDSSQDVVLSMRDLDGDGECNDANEHQVFFDGNPGGNASGVVMSSAQDLLVDATGQVWVASASSGTGSDDAILRLVDVDGDGDANDLNEAFVFYLVPTSGSGGDSIPQDIAFGPDGALYYVENGSTGFYPKGIHRLVDVDGSGAIDQPGEAAPFFVPPALSGTGFHWGFDVDDDGAFYLPDTGNDVIWRVRDANDDKTIDASEQAIWWTAPAGSTVWQVSVGNAGWLHLAESEDPDRVLRMRDSDGDGAIDPVTEVQTIYDSSVSSSDIGNPRGIHVSRDEAEPGIAYCFGGAPGVVCPCGNDPVTQGGCANSSGDGALLDAAGSTSVAADSLVLTVSNAVPGQPGLVFAGLNAVANPFGDGVRCAGGGVVRLPVRVPDSQGSYEERSVASTLGLTGGDLRRFQGWYRDPAGPCGTGFNLTNGYEVTFTQ